MFSRRSLALLCMGVLCGFAHAQTVSPPVVAAYVFPQSTALVAGNIDPHAVTRVNYAFASIEEGSIVLGTPIDAANLNFLVSLRAQNPQLTVLLSVGGWLGSGQFSDMALTPPSRARFVQSAIDFMAKYHLDGIDIDWEYPGMPGSGHAFRPEDKHNFTLLIEDLRRALDRESKSAGRRLYLTIAAGASDEFLAHTEMKQVTKYLDAVNLMSYDYYEPGSGPLTGNHAPLHVDPADPQKVSAEDSVNAFEKAGVPAGKLVLGVPFYGHVWGNVDAKDHGLFQPGSPAPQATAPFHVIDSTMLQHGYSRYWDAAAAVPYLYNPAERIFVSYEDEESLRIKCNFVKSRGLAGVMFWSYFDDSEGKLLGTIGRNLLGSAPPE